MMNSSTTMREVLLVGGGTRRVALLAVLLVVIVTLPVILNLRRGFILDGQEVAAILEELYPLSPPLPAEDHDPSDQEIPSSSTSPSEITTLSPLQERKQRKIVLIHVGKTGGETVRHTLKVTCQMRRNKKQKRLCQDLFSNHIESELSRHTIGTIHCDQRFPSNCLDQATALLWTIRNPVDRIVSWFYYMHPANCNRVLNRHSTACNTNRTIVATVKKNETGSDWAANFFACFSNINELASSLYTAGSNNSSSVEDGCSQIAWRTLVGEGSRSSKHAFYNYAYYWNRTLDSNYGENEVLVVRTESLWQDMRRVEDMFHVSEPASKHPFVQQSNNVTHGSEGHRQQEKLSSQSRQHLCCALVHELAIYRNIIQRASNLEEPEKRQTLQRLHQQCGKTCPTSKKQTQALK